MTKILFLMLLLTIPVGSYAQSKSVPPAAPMERKPSFANFGKSEAEQESRRKLESLEAQYETQTVIINLARKRFRKHENSSLSDKDMQILRQSIDNLAKKAYDKVEWMFYLARFCRLNYEAAMAQGTSTYSYIMVYDAAFWEVCERLSRIPGKIAAVALTELSKGLDQVSQSRLTDLEEKQKMLP